MIGRLLILAAVLGLSEQQTSVLKECTCGDIPIYSQTTSAYCPITTYQTCNSSMLKEETCTISCPYPRSTVVYRNSSAIFLPTDMIKCEAGVLTNGAGAKITLLQRPTCAFLQLCNNCQLPLETSACPTGQMCTAANFIRSVDPNDDCGRITCDNSAMLTLYDANKAVLPFSAPKLYCTVTNKWQNYSLNGNLASGTPIPSTAVSANCRLPASCGTCLNPNVITAPATEMPEAFRTGYISVAPTVNKVTGQCSTVTCPNAYVLMGFVGTTATQTGKEYTNQNFLKCAENGMWTNGGMAYTPQAMKFTCLQKILPCPPVENVLGSSFNVTCNETTKVSSLNCPTGQKLTMRYSTQTSTVKYDRATFFAGKGWLAHGCDSTASLFTTAAGLFITGVCSAST